ncbi:hypothetical protein [Brevibacillus marinus]|uniref:hypothetical protein n=1 Tax=Brevibacillus marinus TaxID=2496837 RepID=UPI000F8227CB|nr:hypothetical protein [Brevibacillus marinus]
MSPTRLRYTMLGFIVGVVVVYLEALPLGVRFAAPFYGAGIGLLLDSMIVRIKQKRGKDE